MRLNVFLHVCTDQNTIKRSLTDKQNLQDASSDLNIFIDLTSLGSYSVEEEVKQTGLYFVNISIYLYLNVWPLD